jgi:uncharacterized protein (TIRG00374 family)
MSGIDPGRDHRAVAGDPDPAVASDAMEITAGELDPNDRAGQLSLSSRLRQPRTIISILIPLVIIAVFVSLNGGQLGKVPGLIAGADLRLVALAFLIFYAGFPMRGVRWATLLRGTGIRVSTRDSTEIIFLSWLVNCVVPAKLGDVYRAYLLKINSNASLSRTFGTVFIERVLDIVAIAGLGIAAGFWSFRTGLPGPIQVVFVIGLVVVAALSVGLFTMRNFGRRILNVLPTPPRVLELYERFEEGVFGAIAFRQLPYLGGLTVSIWMTEALRLFFVVHALNFADVELGLSGAVFVALIGSLLTAVPLSPAGLGIVEAGVVGVLSVAYGVPLAEATAIALLDRVISVFSIIVLGSIGYLVSSKPRGLDAVRHTRETTAA